MDDFRAVEETLEKEVFSKGKNGRLS